MTLADRIKAAQPQPRKPDLVKWIETLTPADRQALEAAARDTAWSERALLDLVRGEGVVVGRDTIAKWRKSLGHAR